MAIPKIIHWCWVGPDAPPPSVRKYIKTWKKYMPDYEIRCWDKNSFDFESVPFVKEAYNLRKWAFVADYIRLYALYHFGGIYLDSDVIVYKSFDPFLKHSFFTGQDTNKPHYIIGPEAAIMGSEKGNPILKDFLSYYENNHFIDSEGKPIHLVMPKILGEILEPYGYKYEDIEQSLKENIKIYSTKYFCNIISAEYRTFNYAFHNNASYWTYTNRGPLFHFCWNHGYMKFYNFISLLHLKIKNIKN